MKIFIRNNPSKKFLKKPVRRNYILISPRGKRILKKTGNSSFFIKEYTVMELKKTLSRRSAIRRFGVAGSCAALGSSVFPAPAVAAASIRNRFCTGRGSFSQLRLHPYLTRKNPCERSRAFDRFHRRGDPSFRRDAQTL